MSNHLSGQHSAYLKQHAENPIDWYPWGDEAFEKASREQKPVFLSIGYAGCHWCHVMARESFEDKEIAEILNRHYVAVKVDREERPDVDAVYLEVCSALNGSAGWPMTILMTPEKKPFWAGTYLPRENRGRQPGLRALLLVVAEKWRSDRKELEKAGEEITAYLQREREVDGAAASEKTIQAALGQLKQSFDGEYGGFGAAPKFPAPQNLLFLMRYARATGDEEARHMVELTLKKMALGGIYDQIGGGFCRYSTDREWLKPHFEKTLYDNALLALCYTEAYQQGRFPLYRRIACETLDYCIRELQIEVGGFCSGQDADFRGVEGGSYLLTPEMVEKVLGPERARHFCETYDVTPEGNFQGRSIPNLLLNERWHLADEAHAQDRKQLLRDREQNARPGRDPKLVTAWNGMLLMALSRAALVFSGNDSDYYQHAFRLSRVLLELCGGYEPEKLQSVYYGKQSLGQHPAQLDDYVFLALGLLEFYQLELDSLYLLAAEQLAEYVVEHFSDPAGGFFRTADNSERLIKRPKEIFDGASPSGNSAAALLFEKLYLLSGREKWDRAAGKQLDYLAGCSKAASAGLCYAWLALADRLYPGKQLVLVNEGPTELLREIQRRSGPDLSVLLKEPEDPKLSRFAPFTADLARKENKPTYYPCETGACSLPFTED